MKATQTSGASVIARLGAGVLLALVLVLSSGCAGMRSLSQGAPPEPLEAGDGTLMPLVFRVHSPARMPTQDKGVDLAGALMASRQQFDYPLGQILERCVTASVRSVFYEPENATAPALDLAVRVGSAELSIDGSTARYRLMIDAECKGPRGDVLDSFSVEQYAQSSFDERQTPRAVWDACIQASRSLVNQLQQSRRVSAALTGFEVAPSFSVDLRLVDLTGTVLASSHGEAKTESALRGAAGQALDEVLGSAVAAEGKHPRVAVLAFDEANTAARRGGHGEQVRNIVETALGEHAGVTVVARSRLKEILSQRQIEETTLVQDPSKLAKAGLSGIDYIITGSVSVLGR